MLSRYIADSQSASDASDRDSSVDRFTTVAPVQIMDAVLTCPGCRTSQAVNITANIRVEPTPRWRGLCLECDHSWDFDDE